MTLAELIAAAFEGETEAEVHAQIDSLREGRTTSDKPFFDLELADATSRAKLKIWSDCPAFEYFCSGDAHPRDSIVLQGRFYTNQYGLNVNRPSARPLTPTEEGALFAGSPERQQQGEADWQHLLDTFRNLPEKRLSAIALLALEKYETKWRRAAAARSFHHARPGGLVEHTTQMLRCAQAIAPLYPEITPGLLYAGVLFHDSGKLWENDCDGFSIPQTLTGEMLGHIAVGIELVNRLWHEACEAHPEIFGKEATPPSDLLRQHLLHLIASHHGTREFGALVTPRTPEAWALHQIDNLDAKIEMLRCAYREKGELAPGIFEPRRPLEGSPIRPLSDFGKP